MSDRVVVLWRLSSKSVGAMFDNTFIALIKGLLDKNWRFFTSIPYQMLAIPVATRFLHRIKIWKSWQKRAGLEIEYAFGKKVYG